MLIEEVLFSLYDRSQNYSKRRVLNFGKEIKTILPALLTEKRPHQHLQYLHLGGLRKQIHFPLWDKWNVSSNHQGGEIKMGANSISLILIQLFRTPNWSTHLSFFH